MLEAYGLSDPGCVRSNNEDYFLLSPELGLYVVADGMGGAQAGEHASKLAAETVFDHIWKAGKSDAAVLAEAFDQANRKVLSAAAADPQLEGMGTTLVALLETPEELLIGSVGDSRVYIHQNGDLLAITEDQTWVNEVGRRLGIDEATLKTHPMRHVLTMAIGIGDNLRAHFYNLRPENGAQILLCSDGLHGVVAPEIIKETLSSERTLSDKCHYLIEQARSAGGPDNVTAVLLRAPGSS
ncbi:MAG: PP2C family protein-serine/threonine phosphatase [Bryobacteraceae bacterium]